MHWAIWLAASCMGMVSIAQTLIRYLPIHPLAAFALAFACVIGIAKRP
jgi:hypothetical protein